MTTQPLDLNGAEGSSHDDDTDVIAYNHEGRVYCLACAQDEFDDTLDDSLRIRAADAHPRVGIVCAHCNEQIIEPVWYSPALYTIKLSNLDDDPTQILAAVQGEFAKQWSEFHGALAGGTWECADGPTFLYDILSFEPGLVDKIEAEGFDLDLSEYSDPDERDITIAAHAAECESCAYDWHRAEKHLGSIEGGSA